jgi:hypothetical protein
MGVCEATRRAARSSQALATRPAPDARPGGPEDAQGILEETTGMIAENRAVQVAALRAILDGDHATYRRLQAEANRRVSPGDHAALVGSAFACAVRRHLGSVYTIADIVRFVGEVRARYDQTGDEIDPRIAERMVRASLEEDHLPAGIDAKDAGMIEVVVLLFVLRDVTGPELDMFLDAAQRAIGWVG